MPFYARYTVLRRLPDRLSYRNAIVLLECVRDIDAMPPVWAFRARRAGSLGSIPEPPVTVATLINRGMPLPSISPAALAAAAEQRETCASVDIVTSVYGKRDLERRMKAGFVLAEDSTEGRIMEALVRLGYAAKGRATRRDC